MTWMIGDDIGEVRDVFPDFPEMSGKSCWGG